MNFHMAETFSAALARLNGQEQKQAKIAAIDLQLNPAHPGLQLHRLNNSRDPNFWSVRVNQDKPFTHVIVDEAQDLGVSELRMMSAISSGPNSLFFAGDLGQRIFQLPFSWRTLGVDVRGRSSSLRINYRTSRQIREAADKLLPQKVSDVDGIEDDLTGAQSLFEGPPPTINHCADTSEETSNVAEYLRSAVEAGISAAEIGVT